MPKLHIMDHSGHSTIDFDKANTISVAEAERRFKELTGAGFTAAVRAGPGESKVVKAFDPNAEETLLIPPLQGG